MRWAVLTLAVALLGALVWFRYGPHAPPDEPTPEPEGPMLSGTVFLPNGLLAGGAIVHLNLDRADRHPVAFADRKGSFAIPVPEGGWPSRVDLVVDHRSTPRNILSLSQKQLASGAIEVVITSISLHGRAVDQDLRPLPYATIDILGRTPPSFWRLEPDPAELVRSVVADARGRFTARVQRRPDLLMECRVAHLSSGLLPLGPLADWKAVADLGEIVLVPVAPPPPPTEVRR